MRQLTTEVAENEIEVDQLFETFPVYMFVADFDRLDEVEVDDRVRNRERPTFSKHVFT